MAKASDNVFPKVYYGMNTADVAAPSDSRWEVYSKANGIFARSSNTIVGPLVDASGAGAPNNSGLTIEHNVQGNSDWVSAYDLSAAATRGFPPYALQGGPQMSVIFDECYFKGGLASGYAGGLSENSSGTGATIATGTPTSGHWGIINLPTGTTTTGRSAITAAAAPGDQMILGGGIVRFEVVVKLSALSDGTDTYSVRLGLGVGSLNAGDVDGVFLRYTHSANGGKWLGVCRNSATESTVDTGSTADTSYHRLGFVVNAGATSVQFRVDGADAGSAVTSNIPTAAARPTPASILKSAGTTSRTLSIDYYMISAEFTTAR